MAATGACFATGGFLPAFGREAKRFSGGLRRNTFFRPSAVLTEHKPAPGVPESGKFEKRSEAELIPKHLDDSDEAKVERLSLKDYFEQSKELIRPDGGPPRWFSPLECGSRLDGSPLLLFLPGFFSLGKFKFEFLYTDLKSFFFVH